MESRETGGRQEVQGFTEEEKAAMKDRIQELKADKEGGEDAVLAKIAGMPEPDRTMGSGSMPSSKPTRRPSRPHFGT